MNIFINKLIEFVKKKTKNIYREREKLIFLLNIKSKSKKKN